MSAESFRAQGLRTAPVFTVIPTMSTRSSLERGIRRLRYDARTALSAHPALFMPYARRKYADSMNRVVEADTELVIDGFQRSANTFSVVAFEVAQPRPVKTAHHLHAVAQIKEAVKLGVPAMVLIRDPDACTVSHLIRKPHLTPTEILSSWIRFYEQLTPYRHRVVTADFREVTTDFGAVIARVNRAFGTTFAEFEHTKVNVERCFSIIERGNSERNGTVVETLVARPSVEREDLKQIFRRELESPAFQTTRSRAQSVYRTWTPAREG
jgi:hypothetical protein